MTANSKNKPNETDIGREWKEEARKTGFPVFPILITFENGKWNKRPLTPNGHKDATTEVDTLDWTGANGFGIRMGDGFFAFDLDVYKPGCDASMWLKAHGLSMPTRKHKTVSGGEHWLYRLPANYKDLASGSNIVHGLDTRGHGGWIAFGEGYNLLEDTEIETLPETVCELLYQRSVKKRAGLTNGLKELEPWEKPNAAETTLQEVLFESQPLRERWNGNAEGLDDKSRSGFDLAVARQLSMAKCDYNFIVWALYEQFKYGTGDERQCMRCAAKVQVVAAKDDFDPIEVEIPCDLSGGHSPKSDQKTTTRTVPIGLPPGLVGDLMLHASKVSRRQGLDYHVGSGLVAVAAASEGKFVIDRDAGPTALNLQVVLIAGTGVGKETDRTIIQQVLDLSNTFYADQFGSAEGLHRQMETTPSVAWMNDEYGRMLEVALSGRGNNYQKELITLAVRLFGLPLGKLTPKPVKDPRNSLGEVIGPFLTVFHTATRHVAQAFTSDDVSNGVLNRPIFVIGPEYAPNQPRNHRAPRAFSDAIENSINWLEGVKRSVANEFQPAVVGEAVHSPEVRSYGPVKAIPIVPNADAEDALHAWQDEVESEMKKGDPTAPLWARVVENTLRVAGVVALGELASSAPAKFSGCVPMTKKHVDWAVAFMRTSIHAQLSLVRNHIADSPEQANKQLIFRALKNSEGKLSQRDLSRKTQKLSARQRNDAIEDLRIAGLIRVSKSSTGGRERTILELI